MNENNYLGPNDLELLRLVVTTFNKYDINFWLDQGSLLGAVRDNAFFYWDHDIDLGTWINNKSLIREAALDLMRHNAIVKFLPYTINIKRNKSEKVIDIRLYKKINNFAVAELHSTTLKNKKRRKKRILNIKKILQNIRNLTINNILKLNTKTLYHINKNISLFLLKYTEFLEHRNEKYKDMLVIFRVDAHYFENLRDIRVYDLDLKVPEYTQSYLKLKYGQDWMVPKKDWQYWKHDGALYKVIYKS